jgi:hypothetical protein
MLPAPKGLRQPASQDISGFEPWFGQWRLIGDDLTGQAPFCFGRGGRKRRFMRFKTIFLAVLAARLFSGAAAYAEDPLTALIAQGKPVIDLRARYETVDDKSKAFAGDAETLRARLGYETGSWNSLQLAFDFDQIWNLGGDNFNSTRNGRTAYPVIADPGMTALNRLQLTYTSDFDTQFAIGRQRILIGDQRFIGNAGWRQHEQTYDSLSAVNNSIDGLTFSYAYLYRINRVYGPDIPLPSSTAPAAAAQANYFKSNSHVMDAAYTAIPGLRLEGYVFLLDLSAPSYATLAAQQTAVAKLSTATYGGRADYNIAVMDGVLAKLTGEYARQTNYANNPLSYSLNYWLGEGSVSYSGATALVGYESLGGNGTIGFSTPLATIHGFDGWADMFLATPANGLNDLYGKFSYGVPADFIGMQALTGTVYYRGFSTDNLGAGIGHEWDLQVQLDVDKSFNLLVQYADYRGANVPLGGFADKNIFWLQVAYKR